MSINIVTDSTCDLPPELAAQHDVTVIPLYVNAGGRSYLDGVELSRQEFYESLPRYNDPPTTAIPGPDMFRRAYERLAERGVTEILSIHISISLSAIVDVARLAAQEVKSAAVTVLDSRQLSMGTGFLVLAAAKAAALGHSMADILDSLRDQIARTHVFAALDTLEFLRRSGRMHWAMASLGSLLRIKPLLKMHDGEPTSDRARTRNGAIEKLIELVKDLGPMEKLALVHTHAPERAQALWERTKSLFPSIADPLSVEVTPVIGSHIGPGAVGFACVEAKQ